jgi:2,4-dienoyl-CoA reductase-like NADH-dependent reductase (Old Yellow Enzyme family)
MIPELEGEMPEELTEEEIEERIAAFKRACKLAILAGFDGVEIHSPHGYLVHDFLSPRYNKRTDSYGGTLENRMRFLMRLIRAAKEVLYDNLTLGARLSLDEHTEDGIRFEEIKQVAQAAAAEGLDYVHLSDGCYERSNHFLPDEDGTMLERASILRESLSVPVITPCLHAPEAAAEAVAEGKTDMVSSSRAFIADPDWAAKVKAGNKDGIRKCIRCNRCIFELFASRPIRCSANKMVGSERFALSDLLGIGEKEGASAQQAG